MWKEMTTLKRNILVVKALNWELCWTPERYVRSISGVVCAQGYVVTMSDRGVEKGVLPDFIFDANAVRRIVEPELERRGFDHQYLHQLIRMTAPFLYTDRFSDWGRETQESLLALASASPNVRCHAAVRVLAPHLLEAQ